MKKLSLTLLTLLMVGVAMAQTKSVSILGDSYSTYEGFMTPSTNELWYYGKNGLSQTNLEDISGNQRERLATLHQQLL